jgi:hypothetical protein
MVESMSEAENRWMVRLRVMSKAYLALHLREDGDVLAFDSLWPQVKAFRLGDGGFEWRDPGIQQRRNEELERLESQMVEHSTSRSGLVLFLFEETRLIRAELVVVRLRLLRAEETLVKPSEAEIRRKKDMRNRAAYVEQLRRECVKRKEPDWSLSPKETARQRTQQFSRELDGKVLASMVLQNQRLSCFQRDGSRMDDARFNFHVYSGATDSVCNHRLHKTIFLASLAALVFQDLLSTSSIRPAVISMS